MADRAGTALAVRRLRPLLLGAGAHPQTLDHLSAASGLVRVDRHLFVVADDDHHLAAFGIDHGVPPSLHRLRAGELPIEPGARKAAKPDLEVLLHLPRPQAGPHGALLAMGSGSGPQRQTAMLLTLDGAGLPSGAPRELSLQALYEPLREHFGDLNIEGGFIDGDELVLLQRGNRSGTPSASLRYPLHALSAWLAGADLARLPPGSLQVFDLGRVGGAALAFTDGAALAGGGWVFSAVAEDSADSWSDGACLGAVIGVVDAAGRIVSQRPLAPTWKVEGIAVQEHDGAIDLLMVTDGDDPATPAWLLGARLEA